MARIASRPPYDASFPKAGSGEFSRIAQEAAKKRSEEKAQEQAQAQERAYAVTEPTPKEEAVEATPIEAPTLKEPIAKPKVKPMPFPRVSFQEDAPRAKKEEQKPKAKPMPFPRYGFQEDAPWAVNGISPKAPTIPAAPQKKVEKPSAASKGEATNIGADLDPHIVAGHRVSFQEDAPWAKDNPYAFGLEQSTRNQNKFAGKSYEDLDKDAVVTSNSLTMGVIGSDPVIKKELNRRKQRLNDFTLIASAPEALAEYGITLSPETRARIENEIRLGTDSLKDLTPLLQKAKRVKYEEGKEKQRTISQVSDRAYQLEREMERAGATKEADKASEADSKFAMMLPSSTNAQIWKTTSYNDKLPDTYRAAMQLQEHATELSQLNKSFLSNLEKSKNWAGGVWEGFKNNILTRKAWQDKEGNTYAANEMALYRVIQAYNNGDNSPEVKKVVEMAAELNSAEAFMRSILPKGYEAGEITAGSIPFMIDFIVTSALTGGAGSAEKAASKVGASGVKALATRGILTAGGKGTRFLELLTRFGQKAAQGVKGVATAVAEKAPGVTRMGGRIVKDATKAAIMTATLNAPTVVSDAERRVTPVPYKAADGSIKMEAATDTSRGEAFRKAFTSQWINTYSAMVGGHLNTYLKALGKLTNFSGTAAGKAIARFNSVLNKAPIVGSVRRAANIQGLGSEFTERMYAGMLNAWLVGDQSMKDVFDAKNMGTTLEALLPTQIAFGILGGGSHALSLVRNQRQLAKINKQLKEEFGYTGDEGKRWEKLTLSEQGKVLDGLTSVFRDAMRRSNEAKDNATRQAAIKEATYARLLFMRLGLQTRRSVLQGADAEAKLAQAQEKFDTLMQEAENALKSEAKRTTTDRAGNSVTVRYNNKEYSVYNTEDVTISQDEKGEPRVLGKGTLYLRAPKTDGGSAEIIPVPSDQVKVVAVQPKEEVNAAIEQSAAAIAEAAIQPELAAQEAESTPTAQEGETKIAPIPTAQEGETKIVPIPTAQEGETKIAPIPAAQVSKQSTPIAQEAESVPIAQEAESTPMAQEAESAPIAQEAESAPMSQEVESVPMSQEAESAQNTQMTQPSEETQVAPKGEAAQREAQYLSPEGTDHLSTEERTEAVGNAPVGMQNREGSRITLTDASGNSLTVQLSDEKDRNGKPYVLTSDGKLSYGVIPGGLVPEEPKTKEVRLSLGNQNDSSINYRYGLIHIMEKHFAQLKELGFDTVEAYIKHVLKNIGGAVLDKIYAGKTTHFVFTIPFSSENHPKQKRVDTVIVELHEESDHWEIINTWRSTEAYIKKKIEKRGTVPSIGLSHAADKTEVFDESTTRSSGSQREGNSPRFSSTNKDTKKSEPSDVPLEKGTNDAEGVQRKLTLTDYKGKSVTVRLSDEKDRNGKPYVLTSDGKLSYGVVPGGLLSGETEAKEVRISLGDDDYGMTRMIITKGIKESGFKTVEAYIQHVLRNASQMEKYEFLSDSGYQIITHPFASTFGEDTIDILYVIPSADGTFWEIKEPWRTTEKHFIKSEAESKEFNESYKALEKEHKKREIGRARYKIETLRKEKPIEVSTAKARELYDFTPESAQKWMADNLRESHIVGATLNVAYVAKQENESIETPEHSEAYYASLSIIPKMIQNGTLIGEYEPKEGANTPYELYECFAKGLSIDGEDYTAMFALGKPMKTSIRYFIPELLTIKKGRPIDVINQSTKDVTPNEGTPPFTSLLKELKQKAEEPITETEAESASTMQSSEEAQVAPKDEAFRIGNELQGKRISERTWHKLVDRLGKSGLATEFVTDSKAFSEKLNSLKRSERELIGGKTVFGFVDKRTGSVYLNPETMDANTPLHECAHLWNALIRTANPELWARGRYLIEQSPYAFEVRNEEAYRGLSAEERADEALARAIADRGEKILKQSGMRGLALRAWIRDVWQHILAFFGIKKKAKTLNDLTDMALGDLLNGQAERYEIPKEKEASQILFRIGNKRRAEYRDRLHKKRTDLSDVAIEKTLDAIEAFGEEEAGDKGDSKLETLALHWTLNGTIDLTREADAKNLDDIPDSTLVRQAAEAARRKKVDPMQYESPSTLLDDIAEGMTFGNRLDPDKEPCFTARHEVPGTDIVVYDVANSKKGQRAVRAFVDSHWGVNANPWCLITRNADAWHYWNHYNYKQKQIAFQNGKLLAFKACDEVGSETPWWNRQDNSSPGVPGRKDLGGGKYLPLVVDEVTGEPIGETQKYALRGERGGNLYEEWTPDGEHILLRETHEGPYKKTFERWTEDGVLVERNKQDRGHLEAKQWYPSGKRKYLSIDTGRGHVSSYWHENGNREEFRLSRNGNMYIASWDEDGQRLSLYTKDAQGNSRRETWNTNGQRSLLEIKDKKGNKHVEQWYIDGQRQSITTKNENGYEQEEKWDRDGTYSLYKTDEEGARREEKRYANGQCSFLEIINKDESSSSETWYENGQRQTRRIIYNGGDSKETWYENGQRKSIETTDKEGNIRKEQWYEDGKRKLIEAKDKKGNERKEQWYEDGGYLLYIADETGKARQDIWFPNGQKKNLLIFNSISEQKFSEWYESGKRKLFHISRDGNSRGAYWYENRQREWVYAKDNAGNKRDERWYENGKRKYIEIEDADKKLYWNISFEESGNVISAECKINRGVINFNWENGVRIDDSISQELNAEEALQKIAEEFEKLTGEPLHFPDNTDVQYRKGAQEKEAIDNPQSAADEVTQHDAYRRALTTQYGEATRDTETDKARKQQVAEDALRKLGLEGVPVEVVSRGDVAEAYARDAMGWHDRKTGKVTIVAENNELEDIEATVLHEVVGHHGLEALLGKEGLATLTHEVLPLIPEAERKRLEDSYGTNKQTIAEEYIAGMAEQYTPPSLWARIAGFIRNALRRIGFRLPLTNGDLLYLTWRGIRATRKEQSSTDTLLHRADEKRVIARCQELDDIQFRKPRKQILSELAADGVDEKGVLKLTEAMNELLEKRVYKLRETWQNDTQSFIELARCVEAATGETIPDEMNIDKVYNQSASKAFARQEETRKKYDRMMQAVRYFARKAQLSPELTELYFLAKHAPERNAEMRRRAEELFDPTTRTEEQEDILNNYYTNLFPGWNKQNGDAYASEAEAREAFLGALKDALTTKDYAAEEAITERIATLIKQDKKSPYKAITDEGNLLNAFTEAVEARAGHQDVYHVWQLVNGFNRGTIELWRSSGMIDEATYQKVTGMFAHYVPMQGWKENTNQTPWEYNIRAHIDTNPLKTMHGRQSLPGSPFEAMLKSAMNSIVAATRNEERQALYFFAQRYGSDYLSASSAWYVLQKEGDTKRWVEAYPETVTRKTEKGDAIESTTQETAEAFFARMKELEAKGLARQRTQSTRPETGYLLSERQEQEHVVPLFFDGQKYNVFVNGNPRFSRAATRHNRASDANGAADKLLRSVRWFTREMGQNITGRSLSFGAANMVRDLLFAEMSSSTIYGTRYALAFNRAYFTDVIPLMLGLKKGDTARLYNEYKANGGRTGFAFLTGDKRSTRSTRNALSNSLTARAGRAGRSFWNAYMGINEHLEDMSRFAAYAAARKMGLGITEATHRAKSITVNFNKRGTGNSPMYQFLSTLYLFFNANLQGVALTGKMFRDHPKRAAAWSIGLILLQPLMTLLYTALANPGGDDDDEDEEDKGETLQEKYDRLPLKDVNPFLRQSNLCIPMGEGKLLKVPLGPEMRALNGIGVTLSDMLMGRATSGDVALATIDGALNSSSIGLDASISSLANANELAERGENGALYTALRGAVPSALQPFGDIAANRDWSGRRIYGESVYHRGTPSYLYADKSTPRWMTNAAAGWNTMLYGQGDKHIGEVSTGLLSVNPSSVNYLAERYLGGILEFVTDINRATDMLTDKNEGSVSQALGQAPVTRRFWKDDPLMQGSEARRNFYSTWRALRQDIESLDRMKRNAKNADYNEANEIRNSIRTYLDGRNEMQLRYLAKQFDTLSDTMKAHDEAYAGKDTETRLSVRERDTRAIERLLKEAERLEAVTK